jgi:hypothetical protein
MRPVDIAYIEREFRLHADLTRKALEDTAAASSLRWSFQVVRGQPLSAVLSAAGQADLLVVGGTVHAAARGALPAAVASKAGRGAALRRAARGLRARPVAVLYGGSPRAERALEVAEALSTCSGSSLAILVPADSEDEFKTLRGQARARLAGHEGAARIVWLQGHDLQTVAQAATAEDAATLLCQDPLDNRQLAALLAAVRCPLVLVR